MITKEKARMLVTTKVCGRPDWLPPEDEIIIVDKTTIERAWGWVFFHTSKKWLETGDIQYAIAGNAPILVEKATGILITIGTARRIEYYLEYYEQWGNLDGADNYKPPVSRDELMARYAIGERNFPETELSDADLSGIKLDGANFESFSWFDSANFSGASLRGTSFRECNLKCADFSNADLTGAIFELAAIESIKATGAVVEGIKVTGATFYGCNLVDGDELPSWEN